MIVMKRNLFVLLPVITALLLAGGLTACRTTQQVEINEKDFSGFLGDYARLHKGDRGEANYIFIDTSVSFAKFTKVYLEPVELWRSPEPDSPLGKLSPETQNMVVSYFHTALLAALKKDFQIVNYAGPDVLVVHAAVTEARQSRPVLNLFSSEVPAGMASSLAKQPVTGAGVGVRLVMVEAEFLDGQTGQRVAAVVDARAGTKALRANSNSTWGDVKRAFDWWAQRLVKRLELLRQGVFTAESL